jgi:hypothetical protein
MTMRRPTMFLTILFPTLILACGGKLVTEQPFTLADGRATLAWDVPVPEGEGSLWLDYQLVTGSEYDIDHGHDPVYDLAGTMTVTTSGNAVYDGVLRVSSSAPPTTQSSSKVTIGSSQSCGGSGCEISGRVRALELSTLATGSPLVIQASLPLEGDQIRIEGLSLQLRAK